MFLLFFLPTLCVCDPWTCRRLVLTGSCVGVCFPFRWDAQDTTVAVPIEQQCRISLGFCVVLDSFFLAHRSGLRGKNLEKQNTNNRDIELGIVDRPVLTFETESTHHITSQGGCRYPVDRDHYQGLVIQDACPACAPWKMTVEGAREARYVWALNTAAQQHSGPPRNGI